MVCHGVAITSKAPRSPRDAGLELRWLINTRQRWGRASCCDQLQQHLQDLDQQLLHLRIRGLPRRRPEPGEFQTFLQRDDAPLIKGISKDLATELDDNSAQGPEHNDIDRAMLEEAMLELRRIVLEEAGDQEASCG